MQQADGQDQRTDLGRQRIFAVIQKTGGWHVFLTKDSGGNCVELYLCSKTKNTVEGDGEGEKVKTRMFFDSNGRIRKDITTHNL